MILFIALLFSACGGKDDNNPQLQAPGQANVTGLDVMTLESFPVQVLATVTGTLNDNCTTLTGIGVQQQALTFLLDVQTIYTDTGACDPTPVQFNNQVNLNVLNLPAGTYTVIAGGLSQTFTLAVDNIAQQPPATDPSAATSGLTANVNTAVPGAPITISGLGFPANGNVRIGFGLQGSPPSQVSDLAADANGTFSTQINLPQNALPGENWVFSALLNGEATYTAPILIVSPETVQTAPTENNDSQPNQTVSNLVDKTNLYFIALQDNGQNGQPVGCNDSIVPVAITLDPPTVAPMTAAYNQLLSNKNQNYGDTGYYNALYQSNLTLQSINIVNREAIVNLTGSILLAGECDSPRLLAQLEQIALQYDSVGKVTIYLDGRLLTQRTEPGGRG